jgi:hypothetical protein
MIQKFFSEDDFYLLRQHIKEVYDQASEYIKKSDKKLKILEIGPSTTSHFDEFEVDWIGKNAKHLGHDYVTFDICGDVDYIGTIEDCEFQNETFDVVIALSVLEHVKDIYSAAKEITRITNKNGKVFLETPFMFKVHGPVPDYWRISEYVYEFLFSDTFHIDLDSMPKNQFGKNSLALSYNAVMTKK